MRPPTRPTGPRIAAPTTALPASAPIAAPLDAPTAPPANDSSAASFFCRSVIFCGSGTPAQPVISVSAKTVLPIFVIRIGNLLSSHFCARTSNGTYALYRKGGTTPGNVSNSNKIGQRDSLSRPVRRGKLKVFGFRVYTQINSLAFLYMELGLYGYSYRAKTRGRRRV